jgi:DNA replication protein DnaC
MSTARLTSAPTLFSLSLGADLGDLTLAQLAQAHGNAHHEFNRMVACKCTRCQTDLVAPQLSAAIGVACDECRKKAKIADSMERSRIYWETLCPPSYQDTDKNHPDFPKLQYGATQDYAGEESLFFYGPSRSGKTRIAMLLLKRCLVRYNKHVGVLWPEVLKSVNNSKLARYKKKNQVPARSMVEMMATQKTKMTTWRTMIPKFGRNAIN